MERVNGLLGPIVSYTARTEGDYGAISISPSIRELLGYGPEDFTENPSFWIEHIHPEDRDAVLARTPTLLAEGWLTQGYRFRHGDGNYRNMWDESHIVKGEDSTIKLAGYWLQASSAEVFGVSSGHQSRATEMQQPAQELIYSGPDGQIYKIHRAVDGIARVGDRLMVFPDGSTWIEYELSQREAISVLGAPGSSPESLCGAGDASLRLLD